MFLIIIESNYICFITIKENKIETKSSIVDAQFLPRITSGIYEIRTIASSAYLIILPLTLILSYSFV